MRGLRVTTLPHRLLATLRHLLATPRRPRLASAFQSASLHLFCLFTTSRYVRATDTYGRRATGLTAEVITTGCLVPGCFHPQSDSCGRQAIGVMSGAAISGTLDIGDRTSDITAASTMASDMEALDTRAATGITERSSTTRRLRG